MSFSVSRKRSLRFLSFAVMAHSIFGDQGRFPRLNATSRAMFQQFQKDALKAASAEQREGRCTASGTRNEETSRRQRVLDQLDPVRGAEHDRLVVEIVGGMMQAGAVAVAAEDKGAGPSLQHVSEI